MIRRVPLIILLLASYYCHAGIYIVANTSDNGAESFRDAIGQANINSGLDTIYFSIPGTAPFIIQCTSSLPAITEALLIDGFSQPGNSFPNFNLVLDGSNLFSGANCLHIAASNCQIQGLKITNFENGAAIIVSPYGNYDELNNNHVLKNKLDSNSYGIYYDLSGVVVDAISNKIDSNMIANCQKHGIRVELYYCDSLNADSLNISNNQISTCINGGISFFMLGDVIDISHCYINNNEITNNSGAAMHMKMGGFFKADNYMIANNTITYNGDGIIITLDDNGTADNYSIINNKINNNNFNGIRIETGGWGVSQYIRNYLFSGNEIKHNAADGLFLEAAGQFGASVHNSDHYFETNIISNNGGNGIVLSANGPSANVYISDIGINSNQIDSNKLFGILVRDWGGYVPGQGPHWKGNNYQFNSIFDNDSLGIRIIDGLVPDTAKYPLPIIDTVLYGPNSIVEGHLEGLANQDYIIDVYSSDNPDPSGYGEGQYYLINATITLDVNGYATFSIPTNTDLTGKYSTATSTFVAMNNTSEFGNVWPFNPPIIGLDEKDNLKQIKIYPNPASSTFTLTYTDNLPAMFELYDITGRKVKKTSIGKGQITIDVSEFVSGLYVWQIEKTRGKLVIE